MSANPLNANVMEILVSRICHDLISPIGAINNGIELIEDLGLADGEDAIELIANSASTASARLSLFRMAYGAAGADTNLKASDFATCFDHWVKGSRVALSWGDVVDSDSVSMPKGYLKTALNMMILAAECLGSGGTVNVELSEKDPLFLSIAAQGDKAHFHEGCEAALNHEYATDQLDPRTVHAYVTRLFAKHYGFNLAYQIQGEQGILFTLSV